MATGGEGAGVQSDACFDRDACKKSEPSQLRSCTRFDNADVSSPFQR